MVDKRFNRCLICILLLALQGCTTVYYVAMEHLGKQKRDILVQRILAAKKDQEAAKEQLKTTLEAFQEVTGFTSGNLEKVYKKLNKEYERSEDRANKLKNQVNSIDKVAVDLFNEWQGEVNSMHNANLKAQSAALLRNARRQHTSYMKQMRQTEARIAPVLQAFSDQVIFLKHNLNARAIQSLKNTSAKIDAQASSLIRDIDASTREADSFIQTLSAIDQKSPT